MTMTQHIQTPHQTHIALVARRTTPNHDDAPIHLGDVVHLQLADGPAIKAPVIFNAPFNGVTTYTTDVLTHRHTSDPSLCGRRIRFRREHVHHVERLRASARA